MYCSSCGGSVVEGLSYCSHCGAKLNSEKGDSAVGPSEAKSGSLVWAIVAVLVFGFLGIVFLLMAMKMVGLNEAHILAFTILSFLIILLVEGVFISQLLRRKRGAEPTAETELPRELHAARAPMLSQGKASVTEHTTRTLDPVYSERKSK